MSTYSSRLQPVLQHLLQCVVQYFHPRSSCTTHISADVQRITLNASWMMISGGRTKQLHIFCHFIGFTSDFLSFIGVELIRFFHGALQFTASSMLLMAPMQLPCLSVDLSRLGWELRKPYKELSGFPMADFLQAGWRSGRRTNSVKVWNGSCSFSRWTHCATFTLILWWMSAGYKVYFFPRFCPKRLQILVRMLLK